MPRRVLLGNRASGIFHFRKLQLSPVPIPETSWGRARLNLCSYGTDTPQHLALLQKSRVRGPLGCSRLHSLESYAYHQKTAPSVRPRASLRSLLTAGPARKAFKEQYSFSVFCMSGSSLRPKARSCTEAQGKGTAERSRSL